MSYHFNCDRTNSVWLIKLQQHACAIGLCCLAFVGLSPVGVASFSDCFADERSEIDAEFHQRLQDLAARCEILGLEEQAAITRNWFIVRRPDLLYLFVPPETDHPKPPESTDRNVQYWHRHFCEARIEQSERLFQLAGKVAQGGNFSEAFRLLHEVLHEHPGHQNARAALGYKQSADGLWLRDFKQIRSSEASRDQQPFGWKRRTYWKVQSRHFSIDCAGDHESGEALAAQAERWYTVWRQLFFDYWDRGHNVKNWIDGKSSDSGSSHQFDVVLFKDRDQYLAELASVPGIEISTGYYNDQQRKSFFYQAENAIDTWRHELTHQWFQETIPTKNSPSENSSAWVIEGIAMFMESMRESDSVVTVGGIDATRLQFARLRFHRDEFFLPLEAADQLGREALQQHADVRQIYSQSAGVCHHLMLNEKREDFIHFLKSLYSRRGPERKLSDFVGELHELDKSYREWLFPVDRNTIREIQPLGQVALSFPKSGVGEVELAAIGQCHTLEWLELSQNPIHDAALAHLKPLTSLQQLFLDSTPLSDVGIRELAAIKSLNQLDLSATGITDAGLSDLAELPGLEVLWLAKTRITDVGLLRLAISPNLQILDIRATEVTQSGIDQLKQLKPHLEIYH